MNRNQFKKMLAGISLSSLLAGASFIGVNITHAGQGG